MTPAPDRSLEQRRAALVKANHIRSYRRALKADLKAGTADVVDVLRDPPAELASMKALDVLLAVPKVGHVKALNILKAARVAPSKTLGGLSRRQRDEIVLAVAGYRPAARIRHAVTPLTREDL